MAVEARELNRARDAEERIAKLETGRCEHRVPHQAIDVWSEVTTQALLKMQGLINEQAAQLLALNAKLDVHMQTHKSRERTDPRDTNLE